MVSSADNSAPVITVDGPSGTGKGTLTALLAAHLGWHLLDSGALYRVVGVGAERAGIGQDDIAALESFAETLEVSFPVDFPGKILLSGEDVSDVIRLESSGEKASRVAAIPEIRQALLARQLAFRQLPGLIADGRDMGTVVFPDAALKIYLEASAEVRAERRHKQLINKGVCVSLPDLLEDIQARDERDSSRSVSPLRPADDAIIIDTSGMNIDQVLTSVLDHVHRVFPQSA